ncbi:hypothetical protein [Mycobacterium sp. 1274756.6]|uniref:hypothetical protein n=1 Tax=Mycobacterium sp. 1274756.6 TaxID=1834076 RepID=UPI0012E8C9AC|nr:hypothetical protein [Mycobacterium sp. 1274756.6]
MAAVKLRKTVRLSAAWGVAVMMSLSSAAPGGAVPRDDPQDLFPELASITAWYTRVDAAQFALADQPGVWFLTPSGLNCGIWFWGGFGCSGQLPGAPPDDHHIAWFNGNRSVHHGWTAAIQFPPGQAQRPLLPGSYIADNSTTCAVTHSGDTYCAHGEFKLLITEVGTWFKGWDDRRSYVCNAYHSCPPG